MAITSIAQNSTDAASGTNASLAHGFTVLAGDVILGVVNANVGTTTATDNNGATSFTNDDFTTNPDSARGYFFSRICGSSEPSSYSFTLSASVRWSLCLRQYRGVDTSSIWDVAPSATSRATGSGDTTAECPSMTVLTAGACGVVWMTDDFSPTTTTFSSVNNSYANTRSETGQQYQTSSDRLNMSAGSSGVTTITSSANVSWIAWQVALRPLPYYGLLRNSKKILRQAVARANI